MDSLWHYRAYGLHWVCDFELPELQLWPDQVAKLPDVTITLGATLPVGELEHAFHARQMVEWQGQRARMCYAVARFTLSQGSHILVEPFEGYGAPAWRVPLLGAVMAALLEQRELFALHAGAVVFPGGAAAFLGNKGQGKSTLNAALSRAGFPLLSDDVVALEMPQNITENPLALCGFSQIKLKPESVRAVTQTEADDWPLVAPELAAISLLDKRAFQAPLAQQNAPLRALFILHSANSSADNAGVGDTEMQENGLCLRSLNAQEALTQLFPHTFAARFGEGYLQGERKKTHFLNCARLVNSCQVWELTRPRDLNLLPATVELVARTMS